MSQPILAGAPGVGLLYRDITVRYGNQRPALDHLSLEVEPGECLVVLGPSGSGKTSLLRLTAGFVRPTAARKPWSTWWNATGVEVRGSLLFRGEEMIHASPQRRNVAMVRQTWDLLPHLTVRESLLLPLRLRGVSQRAAEGQLADVLNRLELTALATRLPSQLSGGEIQRVALGRLLMRPDPNVFLFDECLNSLDPILRSELLPEIRELLRSRPVTTLWVTHVAEEAWQLASRVAVLSEGRLLQIGRMDEVEHKPASLLVFQLLTGQRREYVNTVEVDGNTVTSDGVPLPMPVVAQASGRFMLAVRPGGWHLATDGLRGTVDDCVREQQGGHRVTVSVQGWLADVSVPAAVAVGEVVHVSADPESVLYFSAGDGLAATRRSVYPDARVSR